MVRKQISQISIYKLNVIKVMLVLLGFGLKMATTNTYEYYLGIMTHGSGSNHNTDILLTFVNNDVIAGSVNVLVVNYPQWLSTNYSIAGEESETVDVSYELVVREESDDGLVIKVTSDIDLTVIVYYREQFTVDGFLVYKASDLGMDYYVTVSCEGTPSSNCQVLIVTMGTVSTSVTFTMPNRSISFSQGSISGRSSFSEGGEVTAHLEPQKTVYLKSADDLSGMRLTSDKVMVVMAGNDGGGFSVYNNYEHSEEQMPPINTWGQTYPIVTTPGDGDHDQIWVMTSQDNTLIQLITTNDVCTEHLLTKKGEYLKLDIPNKCNLILANKPISVAHYTVEVIPYVYRRGIYSMYMVAPLEQYQTRVSAYFPDNHFHDYECYMIIITYTDNISNVTLDGSHLAPEVEWVPVPGSRLSAATVQVSSGGRHTVKQTTGVIGGYAYGLGAFEAFSFPLPREMKNLLTGCEGASCIPDVTVHCNITSTKPSTQPATSVETLTPVPPITSANASLLGSRSGLSPASEMVQGFFTARSIPSVQLADLLATFPDDKISYSPRICKCPCSDLVKNGERKGLASVEQREAFKQRLQELNVEPDTVSSHRRQLTSADDDRPSAKAVGLVCAICIFSVLAVVVILIDLTAFSRHLSQCQQCLKNISSAWSHESACTSRSDAVGVN